MAFTSVNNRCGFAWPGTYGHECGREATQTFVFSAENTRDGIYYAGRCDECAKIKGGENRGVQWILPRDPSTQINKWK